MFVRSFLILAINNRSHRKETLLYLLVGEDGGWHPEPSGGGPLLTLGRTWRGCHPKRFFGAQRRQPRGPSALACLGMTFQSAVPIEVKGLYCIFIFIVKVFKKLLIFLNYKLF
jgi:hypothetical protein